MPINFPDSPALNDTFTVHSKTWVWDGVGWSLSQSEGDFVIDGDLTADHINGEFDGPVVMSIKNTSPGQIAKGMPVYATGSVGASGAVEVAASRADTASTMPALGLTQQTLAVNEEGHAVILGVIDQMDTSAYNINDSLYVSTTGGLTTTRPTGDNDLIQKIGRVVRVNQSTGEILVLGAGRTNDVPNFISANGLSIDSDTLYAANGNVGIGTESPTKLLHVYSATTDQVARFESGDARGGIEFADSGTTNSVKIGAVGNDLRVRTGSVDVLNVTDGGNVGIGTTSPDNKLHVQLAGTSKAPASVPATHMIIADAGDTNDAGIAVYSSTAGVGYLRFGDSDASAQGGFSYTHSDNKLKMRSAGSDRVTIDSSGNVGINDTTPSYKLDVNGTGRFTGDVITDDLTVNCSSTELTVQGALAGVSYEDRDGSGRFVIYNNGNTLGVWNDTINANVMSFSTNGDISLRSADGVRPLIQRVGGIYFTWDSDTYGTQAQHSIRSTDGDGWGDDLTINSYGNIRMNIDSNGNGSNVFTVGHGNTGTSNIVFTLTEGGDLTVTGVIDVNEVRGDSGSVSDPSFTFTDDQDTGMYRYGSNSIGFTTGGGYRARISSDGIHLANDDWFRAYNDGGIYWQTHGGGWQMTDSTWMRMYQNKRLFTGTGLFHNSTSNNQTGSYSDFYYSRVNAHFNNSSSARACNISLHTTYSTDYGFCMSAWSGEANRARFVNRINSGYVNVNAAGFTTVSAAFTKERIRTARDEDGDGLVDVSPADQNRAFQLFSQLRPVIYDDKVKSEEGKWLGCDEHETRDLCSDAECWNFFNTISQEHNCEDNDCIGTNESPCPIYLEHYNKLHFLADEVDEVYPHAVSNRADGTVVGIDHHVLATEHINVTQHLIDYVADLQARIEALESAQ